MSQLPDSGQSPTEQQLSSSELTVTTSLQEAEAIIVVDGSVDSTADFEISTASQSRRLKDPDHRLRGDEIAIVGQAARYPGAQDLTQFWRNLAAGATSITEIPPARWDINRYYDSRPGQDGKVYCKWLGALNDMDCFDPAFFNISPAEAQLIDPQQRIFLQEAYRAFEDAGYERHSLSEQRCGVYLGIMHNEYGLILQKELGDRAVSMLTSNGFSIAAARIAYHLNLKGPAIPIDTACSSSLVATHLACQALRNSEIDMALVGGVTLYLMGETYVGMCAAGMLSQTGRCKAFDDDADGFVPGEGVGALVLKRLRDAEIAGDAIYGVIVASGINQDGKTNGITAPSLTSQTKLVRDTYAQYGIDAETISYVEMHGTGTKLGDPIELQALAAAYRGHTSRVAYCAIGSVKSNIGHTSGAAGVASIHKVLLAMQHRMLPPTLHYATPNRYFKFDTSPFVVNTELRAWETELDLPRRAAVSSFGMSGTNAHLVIQEYVEPESRKSKDATFIEKSAKHDALIVLSARNDAQLKNRAQQLVEAIQAKRLGDADLPNIAYTLQIGREPMRVRMALVVSNIEQLQSRLAQFVRAESVVEGIYCGDARRNRDMVSLFSDSDDFQRIIERWMERRSYTNILRAWINGLDFDWQKLHGETPLRRMSLPTYPFTMERYWVSRDESQQKHGGRPAATTAILPTETFAAAPVTDNESVATLTFEEHWLEQSREISGRNGVHTIVCFLTKSDSHQAIFDLLRLLSPQATAIFVAAGREYRKISAAHYEIASDDPSSYRAALRDIADNNERIDGLLYLWALENRELLRKTSPLVYLFQSVAATEFNCPRLVLAAEADDPIDLCYADAWVAFEPSLRLALPKLQVAVLRRETFHGDDSEQLSLQRSFVDAWEELKTDRFESVVYRDGKRFERRLRSTVLSSVSVPLRSGGNYLIAGGAGGIGTLLAEQFVKERAANIILIGRSALSATTQKHLEKINLSKTRVQYVQADVCDSDALSTALQSVLATIGELHGVIHAAGVATTGDILSNSAEQFDQVIAPKMAGTLVLDRVLGLLLAGKPLDFLCYFSSASAVLGDFGSCDYALGNRFQSAYAEYRQRHEQGLAPARKIMAINWPWWKDGGMSAAGGDGANLYLQSSGQRALEIAEAWGLFWRLLSQEASHQLILIGEPSRINRFLKLTPQLRTLEPRSEVHRAPITGSSELAGLTVDESVEFDLKNVASNLLKLPRDQLDCEENLAQFGFDSIGLTEYARRLSAHYSVDIKPSVFFSYPTLRKFGRYLLSEYGEALRAFYRQIESRPVEPFEVVKRERSSEGSSPVSRPLDGAPEPIAIIGMSGRFPQARTIDDLWSILAEGRHVVQEIPPERFDWRREFAAFEPVNGNHICKWLGAIPGVDEFDPLFFEISPHEAELMDPRQRLLLQEAWRALEDAGLGAAHLARQKVGMFVGAEQGDYHTLFAQQEHITANHDAMLAARLAYFLNLSGPAMTLNTACSSGLVAAHQACLSLRADESNIAVVAAANLLLTPRSFVAMSQAGMLSSQGRCMTFDDRADGMVPGEAVVAIVLKRMSRAIADGDPVYATVRGGGINYDGKTNGITAPSGIAQQNLLRDAYERARINARQVEYVVAHGTATKLGDPIEVNALNDAFKTFTSDIEFCALTSVKSNVGHTLAASGLVSLVSLVQAMRREMIPASLHFDRANDYIEWRNSPFYVNKAPRAWPKRVDERYGAVSSFGMSGTNAHMVLSSFESPKMELAPPPFFLLTVSAKSEAARQVRERDLAALLESQAWTNEELLSLSVTLLVGRHHFVYRSAIVVADAATAARLWMTVQTEKGANCFAGKVAGDFRVPRILLEQAEQLLMRLRDLRDDSREFQQALYALADMYVRGYELDWEQLYGTSVVPRMHLPTYPFAQDRYWASPQAIRQVQDIDLHRSDKHLHPLLHRNTSSDNEYRYTSNFTGNEFFLADHVVRGERVLPGVAYLEMARAAVTFATQDQAGPLVNWQLKNVAWFRPLVVRHLPVETHIALHAHDTGAIEFGVFTLDADGEHLVHCEGQAFTSEESVAPSHDLRAIQAQCSGSRFTAAQCYAAYDAMQVSYGLAHRTLMSVRLGVDSGKRVLLAQLAQSSTNANDDYCLHPGLMDGGLQAAVGFLIDAIATNKAEHELKPPLPFALDELSIFGSLTTNPFVYIREASNSNVDVQKLDIDFCNEAGIVSVRLRGLNARFLDGDILDGDIKGQEQGTNVAASVEAKLPDAMCAVALMPVWDTLVSDAIVEVWPTPHQSVLLIGGTVEQQTIFKKQYPQLHLLEDAQAVESWEESSEGFDHIFWIAPETVCAALVDATVIDEQQHGVVAYLRLLKSLLHSGYDRRQLGLTIITIRALGALREERIDPTHAGVHGLAGALAKEYEQWRIRAVDLDDLSEWPLAALLRLPADPAGDTYAYRSGEWLRQQLLRCHLPLNIEPQFRMGGVYVLIGGAGGVGAAFSEYLISRYQAKIIWIGRRELDADIQLKIDRLSKLGPAPHYIAADAANRTALSHAYDVIRTAYGEVHGVVHAALVLSDRSISNMDEDRFARTLESKVDVSVTLAQVFAQASLDFVLFFSALQAFGKSAGQSNYAAGCVFSDAFAYRLAREWTCPVKVINWGYWGSVGAVTSPEYRARMAKLKIGSIEAAEAMELLEKFLAMPLNQLAFVKTSRSEILGTSGATEVVALVDNRLPKIADLEVAPCLSPFVESIDQITILINEVNEQIAKLTYCQLQQMGLFNAPTTSLLERQVQIGIVPKYARWIEHALSKLEAQSYLMTHLDRCASAVNLDSQLTWQQWEQYKNKWGGDLRVSAQIDLADACLRALPDVLAARKHATDVLFPNSSLELVENVYKNNVLSERFNAVLADTVHAFITSQLANNSRARFRIVEIGAGTGATSEAVLRRLHDCRGSIDEYCYTDVSTVFLLDAQERYAGEHPYLKTAVLDIERALEPQSIQTGAYDVVIAANVLHATANIRTTLRNVKAALKSGGLLLLNELSAPNWFSHATFGLLDGWWKHVDDSSRARGWPGLESNQWRHVLIEEGFGLIRFPAADSHFAGQQIVSAMSNGVIRQWTVTLPVSLSAVAVNDHRHVDQRIGEGSSQETRTTPEEDASSMQLQENAHRNFSDGQVRERAIVYLKDVIGQTLKLPPQQINASESFQKYGIDSLLVVRLTNALRESFPNVSNTLFFEHQSVDALAGYLLASDRDALLKAVGFSATFAAAPIARIDSNAPVRRLIPRAVRSATNLVTTGVVENRSDKADSWQVQDIAIIGLAGRFPQANNVHEFWENLKAGKNCIREIPEDRWDWRNCFANEKGSEQTIYTKWGGFLDEIDKFDPLFFRISPREANRMDPQERLFLQEAFACIEDSGYTPATLAASKKIGVFVGVMNSTYQKFSTYWSIPNRVSYLFDFHGPSLAVDTACSSSLTAIHLALESLYCGSSDCAIAGGVNLIVDAIQYQTLSSMTMLSSDEKCRAFGENAEGFVDGEGVGAVVLKPLRRAIADGDHIYGVVKGSMVNSGGRTHGYSVPNPNSQAEVIAAAMRRAQIDPRAVTYIEAHGTGTTLGDPIEIAGLRKAFQERAIDPPLDQQFCAIGSVKSNIGHLEAAAGVVGLTKVLLQMQHATLVPTLHAQRSNPSIDFASTPFKLQQELSKWQRPVITSHGSTKEYPLIAGISSFGAGGANAHLLVQEYVADTSNLSATGGGDRENLIVLSAASHEALRSRVEQLSVALSAERFSDTDLKNVAYTLQVGREAMEHRLAFTAATVGELRNKITSFLENKTSKGSFTDWFQGEVTKNKEALAALNTDDDTLQLAVGWLEKGKQFKLLDLWTKGLSLDWAKLHEELWAKGESKPRRVSLPTYPFAKERCWLETRDGDSRKYLSGVMHPLLQRNTSTLSRQQFSSSFAGNEFFLTDHVVQGHKVLPSAAYLEMARAAVVASLDEVATNDQCVEISDIAWSHAIAVSDPLEVHIELQTPRSAVIALEIYTKPVGATNAIVHAQGRARLIERSEPSRFDILSLQDLCLQSIASAEFYETFSKMGIEYGPAHRTLILARVGKDAEQQAFVLAQLKLPACLNITESDYVLHPSLLDGALQACIALSLVDSSPAPKSPRVPFALDNLQVFDRCSRNAWAIVRPCVTGGIASGALYKVNIDLCDEAGRVCARLKGFTTRELVGTAEYKKGRVAEPTTLLFERCWEARPLKVSATAIPVEFMEQCVVLAPCYKDSASELQQRWPSVKWILLPANDGSASSLGEVAIAAGVRVFEEVQSLLRGKPKKAMLIQVVVSDDEQSDDVAAIAGHALSALLKSAHQENPLLIGQRIVLPMEASASLLTQAMATGVAEAHREEQDIKYTGAERAVLAFKELPVSEQVDVEITTSPLLAMPWRDDGVYLIAGGAGELGLILAEEIAKRANRARIILAGRSILNDEKQARLDTLNTLTETNLEYRVLDVADDIATAACVRAIVEQHGVLHGVVHAAGLIDDRFIIEKTSEQFAAVLAPKVKGIVNLDRATQDLALDLFVAFSSLSGVLGNVGQSDYAMANAFMDSYADYRNRLVAAGRRHGKSLAINWPLWAEGGMRVDEVTLAAMHRYGLEAVHASAGIDAFYQAWRSGATQVVVITGNREKIIEKLTATIAVEADEVRAPSDRKSVSDLNDSDLTSKAIQYLRTTLAGALKLAAHRIDANAEFERYGMDSLMALKLVQELETTFGALPKTLMFEFQSVSALAEYFVENYYDVLHAKFQLTARKNLPVSAPERIMTTMPRSAFAARRDATADVRIQDDPSPDDARTQETFDIAIVGVSGRYPGANNLDEYWANLRAGKDCVTEIPPERWDHTRYFDSEKGKFGKTYAKWGGFIAGVDEFDPLFFNISPREARFMDPQERLFLECAYNTLEDAGYTRDSFKQPRGAQLDGNVGVFVGVMYEEYQLYGAQAQALGQPYTLAGSPASIANRVSYFCNFHGPSIAVDTMCSSSLTAIHFACTSIRSGDCEVAIAGGVNVSIHPNKYLMLGEGQFASSKGRCESFGRGGDGYVPGEGVGAVLLKPLRSAIAADDRIYGVIKATAINHGGKTNGYSVPNPRSQSQVISRALEKAQIDPRAISYIEAHGTGTSLGDPIEIAGLTQAFSQYTHDTEYCAIGSVKSNIGHLESAAGIAAVTKVLLQMQHQMLAPSLHSEVLNPHIDFAHTPFRVQRDLSEWRRPIVTVAGKQVEKPRIAGVSSFGAGGANAHVIIEEYCAVPSEARLSSQQVDALQPVLIVLSATSAQQLRAQAEQLLAFIECRECDENALANFAFTLQVGREALDFRLAFVASSFAVLKERLAAVLANDSTSVDIYRGSITQGKDLSGLTADDDMQALVHTWIKRGKVEKLLEYWVNGLIVDWTLLYGSRRPKRISLPTYQFARDRYWLHATASSASIATTNPQNKDTSEDVGGTACDKLHPFLHRDTSTGEGQRFSSLFTGDELFFTDHVVNGKKLFPSVAYLEMARAAVLRAAGKSALAVRVQLKNILWAQPAIAESNVAMHIDVRSRNDSDVEYEIYSDSEGPRRVHAEGAARLLAHDVRPWVDLQALGKGCTEAMTGDYCYKSFESMNVRYGPAFRTLKQVQVGDDSNGYYVLGELSLPAVASNAQSNAALQFGLHPAMFDGALQSCMGLSIRGRVPFPSQVVVPVSVEQVDIYANLPAKAVVYARRSGTQPGASFVYAIDICDLSGAVCVRLSGFATRFVTQKAELVHAKLAADHSQDLQEESKKAFALTIQPHWSEVPPPWGELSPTSQENVLIVGGTLAQVSALFARYPAAQAIANRHTERIDTVATRVAHFGEINHVIWIAPPSMAITPDADAIIEEQQQGVFSCLRVIKAMLQKGYEHKPLGFTAVTFNGSFIADHDAHVPTHASVHGLVAVLAAEYPNWKVRMIDADPDVAVAELLSVPYDSFGNVWARRGQTWYRQQLTRVEPTMSSSPAFKQGGIYVIVGGAGGIGAAFSEYLISRYQAKVIWLGRRPQSDEIAQDLARLAKLGPSPIYISADATDRESLQRAYTEIVDRYGPVNGVIHAAFASLDKSLLNMDEARFNQALTAKVDVSVRLAQVFAKQPLDFVLFMSSLQSFIKRPGQSNYAAGCVFKDAFAAYLSKQWDCAVRTINWGYWGSVGAAATEDFKRRMQKVGLESIELEDGVQAIEQLMTGPYQQVGFFKANDPRVVTTFLSINQAAVKPEPGKPEPAQQDALVRTSGAAPIAQPRTALLAVAEKTIEQRVREVVIATFATALQLQENQIDVTKSFSNYGLDSIVGVQLSRAISKRLGIALSSTGLFAFTTVNELTGHIVEKFADVLSNASTNSFADNSEPNIDTKIDMKTESAEQAHWQSNASGSVHNDSAISNQAQQAKSSAAADSNQSHEDGIAIIGVAGRFPQARNVEEFWELLVSGKDLVTEVPAERWSTEGFYEPDVAKALAERKSYSKWGGFMPGSQAADLDFFQTDSIPHSLHGRHFMEVTWNATESAGYSVTSLAKKHNCMVGVYVGGISGASDLSIGALANNVATYFNCRGPCFAVDTMSASSLTALHLACEGLRRGECEVAIAGGVSLLDQQKFRLHSAFKSISPSRETRSYTRGDGTQLAECAGVVVLKPLSKAIAARDPIRGVIRFSQMCHLGGLDGKMIPDVEILVKTITEKMRTERIDPSTITYMETAGNGIRFGDQLELILLNKLFRQFTNEKQFCRIGTVKSYMGHSEAASGVSQLIKVILQLDHQLLLPLLGHENMDPEYDLRDTAFTVQRELESWPQPPSNPTNKTLTKPLRRALINSVGIGGTLANLLVEEYANDQTAVFVGQVTTPRWLVMSAMNPERLSVVAKQLLQFVTKNPFTDLTNLTYTLQTGREPLRARIAVLIAEPNQLKPALEACLARLAGDTTDSSLPLWIGSKTVDAANPQAAIDPKTLKIEDIGARWVTGSLILWERLYATLPQKVALPGYPFAQMPSTATI